MKEIVTCELNYSKQFCDFLESEDVIQFKDDLIPDMYSHHFTLIKNEEKLLDVVKKQLNLNNKHFLKLIYDGTISFQVLDQLEPKPTITRYDVMVIDPKQYETLIYNEACTMVEPNSEESYKVTIDLETKLSAELGEFATRKIIRKIQVYKDHKVRYFMCFYQGEPVGSCELFIDGEVAKLEEFSVLDSFQRKGIGTTILRHLLHEAFIHGVKTAYVVTDQDDTAKFMYEKCGFQKVMEKTELFYKFE